VFCLSTTVLRSRNPWDGVVKDLYGHLWLSSLFTPLFEPITGLFFIYIYRHHLCKGLLVDVGLSGRGWRRYNCFPRPLKLVLHACQCLNQCFPNFSARGPFWASKNNQGFLYPYSRKYCSDDSHPEWKTCTSELVIYIYIYIYTYKYIPVAHVTMHLHDLTLIKVVVDRFLGYREFLN